MRIHSGSSATVGTPGTRLTSSPTTTSATGAAIPKRFAATDTTTMMITAAAISSRASSIVNLQSRGTSVARRSNRPALCSGHADMTI